MRIQDYLANQHVLFEVLLHPPTSSATRLARSVHVPGHRVAKAVLVSAGDAFVMCVLPSTHRVDLAKLGAVLNPPALPRIATEAEVASLFHDCEPGALPPFGSIYGLTTLVDATLEGCESIVFEANTRYESVRMRFRDYEKAERIRKLRFAAPIAPGRSKSSDRQAG